jgi:hypothetical protein
MKCDNCGDSTNHLFGVVITEEGGARKPAFLCLACKGGPLRHGWTRERRTVASCIECGAKTLQSSFLCGPCYRAHKL